MKIIRITITTIILLILLCYPVLGDPEQYITPGVDRGSSFTQDGTGIWTDRTPITYTRTYNNIQSYFPLVGDVDGDDINEIIIVADNNLVILNMTFGIGMLQEQSVSHGTTTIQTQKYTITPALFDYDSDDIPEIVSFNTTHMILFDWNGTAIVVNQSATTGLNVSSVTATNAWQYPVIKCGQSIQFSTSVDSCVMPITNRSGATAYTTFMIYDIDTNVVTSVVSSAHANEDNTFRNTHLVDGDSDGNLEAYFSRRDGGLGDLFVYEVEINNPPTVSLLHTHALGGGSPFTDIVVNNLIGDGGELEITYGFSSDGTNWDARTLNANTGGVIDSSYCTALSCPEGESASANMWIADDTTYSDYSGNVCYYVRNAANNDPGVNTDTVHCLSQYAGAATKETTISNTQNFGLSPVVHKVALHSSAGLLLPYFSVLAASKLATPALDLFPVLIPVDVEKSGSLDIIGMNSSLIRYYEDAYTNNNYDVVSLSWDTGNDVCVNELVSFSLGVEDDEEDSGTCFYTEQYSNLTQIVNSSNVSVIEGDFVNGLASVDFNYHADTVGTFIIRFSCHDQYNSVLDNKDYVVVVGNGSDCNRKGSESGSDEDLSDAEQSEEADFESDIEQTLDGLGLVSTSARSIIAIIGVFMIAVLVFLKSNSIILAITSIPASLMVAYFLGIVGLFPLIVLIIFCASMLAYLFVTGRASGV